jgi:hypothetical protein
MSKTTGAELEDVWPREPRCRVCRDPDVRRLVNDLLDWRGALISWGAGRFHRVTSADILLTLEPLNETRDKEDQITYKSLWVHAKRHYDLAGIAAYWTSRIDKELRNALGDNSYRTTIE